MKKFFLIGLLLSACVMNAQDFKKLVLTLKTSIKKQATIYVETIDKDPCLVVSNFKNSLESNGFKIASDKKGATYLITVKYHHRSDTGCGGYVIKVMDGTIIDIKNNAETVADFSFSQGAFGGKCASDIFSALAKKIKESEK